jgi:two-component system CheB/CheR fusion protein
MSVLPGIAADLPLAYVVAQHMAPEHDSPLVELLARTTELVVEEALDGAALRPGVVLVAPPNSDVEVTGQTISVLTAPRTGGPHPSVDRLLISVASSWRERGAALVLSGSGFDGASGLRSVVASGGLGLAQSPSSAKFPSMPAAAIDSGSRVLVLDPEDVGPSLARWCADPEGAWDSADSLGSPDLGESSTAARSELLDQVVAALRARTGLNFAGYKLSTVARQVARRQAVTGVTSLLAYLDLVTSEASEAQVLARAMQVGVTSFFRDPLEWDALVSPLGRIVAELEPGAQLRIWVAGSSTGEEAYTVAMLAAEALGRPDDVARRLKVFATDISDADLDVGRRGRYSRAAALDVPERLRDRWLVPGGDEVEIRPELREVVVFARHNLAVDPPFPRLHLITCRNTLIYFGRELQDRALRLCHFALQPGGLLMLGTSERVPPHLTLFTSPDPRHRLFARAAGSAGALPPAVYGGGSIRSVQPSPPKLLERRAALREALIARFAPASLVIDAAESVIEVVGDVTDWCWVAQGPPSAHVVAMLREELRPVVRSMLLQLKHGSPVTREVHFADGVVRIGVTRIGDPAQGLAAVSFEPLPTDLDGAGSADLRSGKRPDADIIGEELESTRAALQVTIEELGASNEELQALNEELQASTEELQASNEEVQASNEELEVANEELRAASRAADSHADALARTNADLATIQVSMGSGMILVDESLAITRFTPLAVRLFALIDTDLGRPLAAIPTLAPIPELDTILRDAIERGTGSLIEVSGPEVDYLVGIQPYRREDGTARGATVVVTDITELARARRAARRSAAVMAGTADALREVVWQSDSSGRLMFLNAAVEDVYGLSRIRVLADPGLLRAAIHPDDRERVAVVVASAERRHELTYRIVRPDGTVRWLAQSSIWIAEEGDTPGFTVGSALDITDRFELEQQANERSMTLERLFDNQVVGVAVLDAEGRVRQANETLVQLTGFGQDSLVGMELSSLLREEIAIDGSVSASARGATRGIEHRVLTRRDGESRHVTLESTELPTADGRPRGLLVTVHDLDRLRSLSSPTAAQDPFDRHTGVMNRDHFRSRVAEELARGEHAPGTLALLWIDLDGFKSVNDHYGHRVGDIVLAETARRIVSVVRHDDVVGRLGGDEFAVLANGVGRFETLEPTVERMLVAIREPIAVADMWIYLTASVGIAVSPVDGTEADTLLHNADTAMYSAKAAGRDRRAYFQSAMNAAAESRATVRHRLAASIRSRDFVMHYQPIVSLDTGQVGCVEALLRWQDGAELVSAGQFIDIANESGLMRELGRLILDLVDADLHAIAPAGQLDTVLVALNLSADELNQRETFERLAAWMPTGGYSRVVIEVTETALFNRSGRARDTLSLLRRLGASLSIDDFGTGYSNLARLGELGPEVIKIDASLLVRAAADDRGMAILGAAVQMARAYAATVVLEGVETREQLELARTLGVDQVQGFLLARPMPREQLAAWLDRRHPDGPLSDLD